MTPDTITISTARYRELLADKARLDWLADREQRIGNVQLPIHCVMLHLDSLRDAIDAAMEEAEREREA